MFNNSGWSYITYKGVDNLGLYGRHNGLTIDIYTTVQKVNIQDCTTDRRLSIENYKTHTRGTIMKKGVSNSILYNKVYNISDRHKEFEGWQKGLIKYVWRI